MNELFDKHLKLYIAEEITQKIRIIIKNNGFNIAKECKKLIIGAKYLIAIYRKNQLVECILNLTFLKYELIDSICYVFNTDSTNKKFIFSTNKIKKKSVFIYELVDDFKLEHVADIIKTHYIYTTQCKKCNNMIYFYKNKLNILHCTNNICKLYNNLHKYYMKIYHRDYILIYDIYNLPFYVSKFIDNTIEKFILHGTIDLFVLNKITMNDFIIKIAKKNI